MTAVNSGVGNRKLQKGYILQYMFPLLTRRKVRWLIQIQSSGSHFFQRTLIIVEGRVSESICAPSVSLNPRPKKKNLKEFAFEGTSISSSFVYIFFKFYGFNLRKSFEFSLLLEFMIISFVQQGRRTIVGSAKIIYLSNQKTELRDRKVLRRLL